jgi:hypothetical protein
MDEEIIILTLNQFDTSHFTLNATQYGNFVEICSKPDQTHQLQQKYYEGILFFYNMQSLQESNIFPKTSF